LRPRRRSASATRYQPYTFSSSGSPSRPVPKPTHVSSSQSIISRPKTTTTKARTRPSIILPVPIPVPNLTKKSRGRRVPTADSLATTGGRKSSPRKEGEEGEGKNARTYTCEAAGCGKCFARGEHLKRHVRSIHTYEKRQPLSSRFSQQLF
jgi:uncharacterized Zn-finger protein